MDTGDHSEGGQGLPLEGPQLELHEMLQGRRDRGHRGASTRLRQAARMRPRVAEHRQEKHATLHST